MSLVYYAISVLLSSLMTNAISEMDTIRNAYASRNPSDKYAKFQCHKYKYCTHGGVKVCAYDQELSELATFEDLCTLYLANCKMGSRYFQIQMNVCDMKTKFQAEYGHIFDWQPIIRNSTNHNEIPTNHNESLTNHNDNSTNHDESSTNHNEGSTNHNKSSTIRPIENLRDMILGKQNFDDKTMRANDTKKVI